MGNRGGNNKNNKILINITTCPRFYVFDVFILHIQSFDDPLVLGAVLEVQPNSRLYTHISREETLRLENNGRRWERSRASCKQ